MSPPKVSIVIPTYNRLPLLQEALNSIFDQTYPHWEAIVIDDSSSDETRGFMCSFVHPRVRYLRHAENQGGADARNTGIKCSRGDYIAFLDSDDTWEPQKLEIQLDAVLNCRYPDWVVSYTKIRAVSQDSEDKIFPLRSKNEGESVAEYLFLGQAYEGLMQTSSLMISRSLIAQTRFRSKLKKHHDFDLVIRLETQGAFFLYVPEPLTIWRHDRRCDRLSNNRNYRDSVKWIGQCQSLISRRAKFGFLYRSVYPNLLSLRGLQNDAYSMWLAQWILLNAYLCGIITRSEYFESSGWWLCKRNSISQVLNREYGIRGKLVKLLGNVSRRASSKKERT